MEPKRILIFGQGQVGTFYRDYFAAQGIEILAPKVDVRDADAVLVAVQAASPDVIINATGKTDIDWCERNRLEAVDVNTLGADNIGAAARQANTYLVHVSSGCIQESLAADEVRSETDPPHPLCFYSWTKVWAENLLLERASREGLKVLILRPRQLLSSMPSPRNALVKMLTYVKFIDTPNSCTVVEDLMTVTGQLVKLDATGVYNVVNPGITTPYRIAELLKLHLRPEMRFVKISKAELNDMTFAKRIDAVLSTAKLNALGITLRPVEERLVEVIAALKKNLESAAGRVVLDQTSADTAAKLALR